MIRDRCFCIARTSDRETGTSAGFAGSRSIDRTGAEHVRLRDNDQLNRANLIVYLASLETSSSEWSLPGACRFSAILAENPKLFRRDNGHSSIVRSSIFYSREGLMKRSIYPKPSKPQLYAQKTNLYLELAFNPPKSDRHTKNGCFGRSASFFWLLGTGQFPYRPFGQCKNIRLWS